MLTVSLCPQLLPEGVAEDEPDLAPAPHPTELDSSGSDVECLQDAKVGALFTKIRSNVTSSMLCGDGLCKQKRRAAVLSKSCLEEDLSHIIQTPSG